MTPRARPVAAMIFSIAVMMRLLPLHWTPYPFNPDGFVFAAQARAATIDGHLPIAQINPHGYSYPTILAVTGQVTGVEPLWLAQPTIAVVGSIPPLLAFALVFKFGRSKRFPARTTLIAATTAGFVLAVEGVYLRRTVTVSYEVLGLLFVPLLAIAAYRSLDSRRPAWVAVATLLLVVLPITHHLSTMLGALTLTAVVAAYGYRNPTRVISGILLALVFWLYFGSYYAVTRPPFSDDLAAKPGVFLAWVVILVAAVGWLSRGEYDRRSLRVPIAAIWLGGFSILALDAQLSLFPGTMSVPTSLLVYVLPLTVVAALAVWGLPIALDGTNEQAIVLALLIAPIAWIGFAVTAGLDPVYALFARRGQTFVHFATVVLAGVAILDLYHRIPDRRSLPLRRGVRVGIPLLLCLCALVSTPFAFAGLETLAYEGTTTGEQFRTLTFASDTLANEWTSDDHLTRVARNYYGVNVSPEPTYDWIATGETPTCPTIVRSSWTIEGAQRYPSSPQPVDEPLYLRTVSRSDVIYATTGDDSIAIVDPRGSRSC